MKKVLISLALFVICLSVLGYMRIFKTNDRIDILLVWLSLFSKVFFIFQTTLVYRKRGYKIRFRFEIFKIIVSVFAIYFSIEFLLKKDHGANLLYNLPLCLFLIIIGGLTFMKLEKSPPGLAEGFSS